MTKVSHNLQTIIDEFMTFNVAPEPKIIVFNPKITNRLKYTCDFIFKQSLKVNYILTENETEFIQSNLPKVNYSDKIIDGAANILPFGILHQTDYKKIKIEHVKSNESIHFFHSPDREFEYDIFTSVFYFISRYEEWLPYFGDKHGRFEPRGSVFYFISIYKKPVVDFWILEFKNYLLKLFPDLKFPEKKFRYLSTIDVDNVYAYKAKPFSRAAGANFKDFINLNFENIQKRMQTRLFGKPDPFDGYDLQMELSKKYNIPLIYFFLYRNNTKYDRTIDPNHPEFKKLLKKIRNNSDASIGIHPSYLSSNEPALFAQETDLLRKNSGGEVSFSRQHYLRFDVRRTPQDLINAGIKYDFSMGYAVDIGFRAGTSMPFYYFDLDKNEVTGLMTVPFAIMDGAYYTYLRVKPKDSEAATEELINDVKSVNGLFVSVFHDRTFSQVMFPGWKAVYTRLQEKLKWDENV